MTEPTTSIWTGEDLSDAQFSAIKEFLRDRRRFDLGQYKDRCVRRRIAKRLRLLRESDFDAYLKRLDKDREELDTLLATLSVHVSQFFRNPDTFRTLEQKVLPDLCLQAKRAGRSTLTLWSAGCASGEEPYSLAMLADDLAPAGLEILVLATDISESVLAAARNGCYEATRLREVPRMVIKKYFRGDHDRYQLVERIRDRVRFMCHDLMANGDYPTADLVLCRNVMIYFTRQEQERILSRFAAAMPQNGALVLGGSETMTGEMRSLFRGEFPLQRIYRRTACPAPGIMPEGPEGIAPGEH